VYKILFPTANATLFEQYPDRNTSSDEILEISPVKTGEPTINNEYLVETYNSRILIKFDVDSIQTSINGKRFEAFLKLHAADSNQLSSDYTLYSYPVSGGFSNGTGFKNNNPEFTDGVSWNYRTSKLVGQQWQTSSYAANVTGSSNGGGNWFTNISGSQRFRYETPDVYMNVTSILNAWLSGSIENNGFIVKYKDSDETSLQPLGNFKFYSLNSHTIYIPRLDIYYDDSILSGTSSFSQVGSDGFVCYIKNLKDIYSENEIVNLRIGVRDRHPVQTYSTSSNYLVNKRMPVNSYFQVKDDSTDEIVIPFNTLGTRLNCDSNGNYVRLDCSSLLPERYYKIIIKSEFDDGSVLYADNNFTFRITRY